MTRIEPLRTVYSAWQRGDFRARADVYDHDMEWGWSAEFPGLAGVVRDSGPRSRRMLRWLSAWEHWRVEPEEYIAAGESVVVLTRYLGRGKESGVRWTREGRTSGGCAMARPFVSRSSRLASGHSTPPDCERGAPGEARAT
jgi:ketosteroid isomerase-like protein